jgi:hypothetical protein
MNPVLGLSLGRIAVGTVALARPDVAARTFQLGAADPQLSYIIRLFGSREVALGLLTVLADGGTRRTMVLGGALVDAADAATGYLRWKEGAISRKTAIKLIAPAVGAVGAGIASLRTG